MALPLYIPFAYITFLFGLLWLFSRYYRSRSLRRKPPPPWFPEPHAARDIYVSLLSMDPPPAQPVLVAALIARAITDVQRIWSIKESKQAMTNLLQKGQVGDDLCERLAFAEQELEVELAEVVAEANEYADGWGQVIFSIASEAAQANKARDVYKNIEKERQNKVKNFKAATDNPGELSILRSKPAIPAAQPKPTVAPSPAKQAMLDAIKAAQAKQQMQEQQQKSKPSTPAKSKVPVAATPKNHQTHSVPGSTSTKAGGERMVQNGSGTTEDGGSGSDAESSSLLSKSAPTSASKKKKPKRKKKA